MGSRAKAEEIEEHLAHSDRCCCLLANLYKFPHVPQEGRSRGMERKGKPDSQIHCSLMGHLSLSSIGTLLLEARSKLFCFYEPKGKSEHSGRKCSFVSNNSVDWCNEGNKEGCRSWRDKYFPPKKKRRKLFLPLLIPPLPSLISMDSGISTARVNLAGKVAMGQRRADFAWLPAILSSFQIKGSN